MWVLNYRHISIRTLKQGYIMGSFVLISILCDLKQEKVNSVKYF